MNYEPGDIVTHKRRPGLWVVKGSLQPAGIRVIVIVRDNAQRLRESYSVCPGDLTLIKRPDFSPGQMIRWEGRSAEIAERGETESRVRLGFTRQLYCSNGAGRIVFENIGGEVGKADVVLANLNHFKGGN